MGILTAFLNAVVVLICLFLICLILIQRGKGGGLAGAFGGVGGSSAFGTKAGDIFTRVTMIVAGVWIVLSMILVILYNQGGDRGARLFEEGSSSVTKEVTTKSKSKTTGTSDATSAKPATGGDTGAPSSPAPVNVPAIPDIPVPAPK